MDIITLAIILSFILLVVGSYTDFRWLIVPDWLSYTAIITGISIRLTASIIEVNPWHLFYGLLGLGVFFGLGCIGYYLKLWGGGDTKILAALGAILGFWPHPNDLMVGIVSNFLLVGGIYGFAYFIILATTNFQKVSGAASVLLSNQAMARMHLFVYILCAAIIVGSMAAGAGFAGVVLALGSVMIFYVFILSKAIEQTCFIKDVPLDEIEEGDWVAEPVIVNGKKVTGPDETGITTEQIDLLRKARHKTVPIKEGIPFIPNFLLIFVTTILWGNIVLRFVGF